MKSFAYCALLASFVTLSACATPPPFQMAEDPGDDRAHLYLIRVKRTQMSFYGFKVIINGGSSVELRNASYAAIEIAPGPTQLTTYFLDSVTGQPSATFPKGDHSFLAKAGQTYFLELHGGMGRMSFREKAREDAVPMLESGLFPIQVEP